jgi:hypothetical protein
MRRSSLSALLVSCVVLLPAFAAHAQSTASDPSAARITLGQSIVPLNGPWKFHVGDDPRWADPNFDDSQWETVELAPRAGAFDPNMGTSGYVPGWTAKGHPRYWGYAWYRIQVRVAAQPGQKLALAGPADVDDAYQVFLNGALLGGFGKFGGPGERPTIYNSQPAIFVLPEPVGPAEQVMAFRVWMEPATLTMEPDAGGMHNAPLLGESGVVVARYRLAWQDVVRAYAADAILAALFFLLAILAASLILFDRSDRVYWWLAAVFLLCAAGAANLCFAVWTQIESGIMTTVIQDAFLRPLILGGWVMVWWTWFRLRRPMWVPKAIAVLTLLYMLSTALGEDIFFTVIPHPVGAAFHLSSVVIRTLFLPLLVLIVIRGVPESGREGWLALPAVALVGIAQFQAELNVLHIRTVWFPLGTSVTLSTIAYLTLAAVIFVLLLRRLLLSMRRQRELALDVKQAQEVQRVLIPEKLPELPGLAIESEYRPALEVGGDFFQIIPHRTDGSVLIVVGDVTGKGLQAGMLVALLVGAIRSTAETHFDPLLVLEALNRRLLGRNQAHATCLALHITADGAVTLANAGHLPPYLNGEGLAMEGALPLGMMANAEFSVMRFQLAPNDRLLLLSDGVAEAQDAQGRLFGFERIHALLEQPLTATQVAAAAQHFGQQDDISVLSITRTAVAEMAIQEPALA